MITTKPESDILTFQGNVLSEIDASPFKGLNISEHWKKLDNIADRTVCGSCKKSRKYFCYSCYVPVPEIQELVPNIKLPIKIDIIKHAKEIDGKSTAVHAAVLAPEDVQIYTYPCIPDYNPEENVVLIFPNKDAVSVEEACNQFYRRVTVSPCKKQCLSTSPFIVHRAVFIDSTWNQSRGIFKDPRIKALPSVVLKTRLSQFWRHQADSPRWYLATVEAIHQFLVELEASQWKLDHTTFCNDEETSVSAGNKCDNKSATNEDFPKYIYNGQYDNLLFFFRFMYSKIHTLYNHNELKSYKRKLQ